MMPEKNIKKKSVNSSEKVANTPNKEMKQEKFNVKKCLRCGKLFKDDGFNTDLCPNCISLDNDDFDKVRTYLYEYHTATAIELADGTGVSIIQIERYLKNGRLEIPEGSPIFIKCEKCGADIRSGRLCSACSLSISNNTRMEMHFTDSQIGETPKTHPKAKEGKMYYFNTKERGH